MSQDKINDMMIRSLSSSLHEIEKENKQLREMLKEFNDENCNLKYYVAKLYNGESLTENDFKFLEYYKEK